MENKLKSCPFCNSKNLIDKYVYIKCDNCGAKGPTVNNGEFNMHADHVDHMRAIALWNKRKR